MVDKNSYTSAFRSLFIAPSGRGKSFLISEYVISLIKDKFVDPQHIIIFSMNFKTDPSQRKLIDFCNKKMKTFEQTHCYKDIEVDLLLELYDSQEKIKEQIGKVPPNYLIILDDQICNDLLTDKKTPLRKFLTMGRHMNISIIFALQKYRGSLNTLLRDNMNLIFVGSLASQGQIEDLLGEYTGMLADTKREAYQILYGYYQDAVKQNDGRGFLCIHCDSLVGQGRFQRGMDDFFYDHN